MLFRYVVIVPALNVRQFSDPTGYHLSEKYDGIRAFWDHKKKKLVSRLGNRIHAPSWFTKDLPNRMSLDGELWSGRNKFHQAVSIIRTSLDSETSWKNISYRVFDTPSHGDLPFEERLECLQKWISRVPPTEESPKLVSHRLCKSQDDLITTLDEVERDGGEGLMLRAPGSLYEAGRSSTLLKVKRTSEEECMVVAYTAGVGRNEGRVGSLVCLMRNGKLLRLGSGLTDEARENPPKIGSIVTCRYMGVTRDNIPRFATLRGERID
ncbi:DNA ligase, partial [Powellomyces hirtus]